MKTQIEPGCLCILVNCQLPENNGKTVTAVRYIGQLRDVRCKNRDLWELDQNISCLVSYRIPGTDERRTVVEDNWKYVSSKHLLRIGDSDITKELEKYTNDEIVTILKNKDLLTENP